jgi:hypothetical protein
VLLLRRFRHFQAERFFFFILFSSSYGQSTGVYFWGSTQKRFKVKKKTYTQQDQNERRRQVLLACLPCKKTWTCSARTFFFSFFLKKTHTKNKTFSIPHSPRTGYWINKRERRKGGLSLYFRKKKKKKYLYNHMQIGCKWWWRSAPKVIFQSLPPRALACFNSSFNLVTVHACSHLFLSLFLP